MTAKNLFTFVAIIVSLFGLALTFAPAFMAGQYLTNPAWLNDSTKLIARLYGTHLLAYAAGCWYVRNADASSLGSKVMQLTILLSNLGLIAVHVLAISTGVEKPLAWGQVLLSIVLASWSGMLFRQTQQQVA